MHHDVPGITFADVSAVTPEGRSTLPLVLLHCLKRPFMSAIIPRLFLIMFRYSQTILISITIQYINNSSFETHNGNAGRWLVLFAIVTYVGMAVSDR